MSIQVFHWENRLLALAHQALESHVPYDGTDPYDQCALERAYQHCENFTKFHSRTFYLASSLLPEEKRRAVHALYSFCRVSDDVVDRSTGDARAELKSWRRRITCLAPGDTDPVILAWNDTRRRFQIPMRYGEQLIDGVALDLDQVRYETFGDLAHYCYGVACTVGIMSMHIVGHSGTEALSYAIRLGVALQLTNILRDIGEDSLNGRIYLPQEEMRAFGLNDSDILAGEVHEPWREFMRFQIDRNRRLYASSLPGIKLLDTDGRFAIAAAAELYQAILLKIEENDFDVFGRRAAVSGWGKLRRLPGIWWRAKSSHYSPQSETIPQQLLD